MIKKDKFALLTLGALFSVTFLFSCVSGTPDTPTPTLDFVISLNTNLASDVKECVNSVMAVNNEIKSGEPPFDHTVAEIMDFCDQQDPRIEFTKFYVNLGELTINNGATVNALKFDDKSYSLSSKTNASIGYNHHIVDKVFYLDNNNLYVAVSSYMEIATSNKVYINDCEILDLSTSIPAVSKYNVGQMEAVDTGCSITGNQDEGYIFNIPTPSASNDWCKKVDWGYEGAQITDTIFIMCDYLCNDNVDVENVVKSMNNGGALNQLFMYPACGSGWGKPSYCADANDMHLNETVYVMKESGEIGLVQFSLQVRTYNP